MDYLNYEGVAFLWGKIKEKIANAISTKQDKITTSNDLHLSEANQLSLDTGVFKEWLISYAKGVLDIPYNRATGYFECNGLDDLTDSQILDIIYSSMYVRNVAHGSSGSLMFASKPMRTLPAKIATYSGGFYVDYDRCFQGCGMLESINLSRFAPASSIAMMFRFCRKLHTIKGMILHSSIPTSTQDAFLDCINLQNVEIDNLHNSINFSSCELITRQSLEYIMNHATNGGYVENDPISITLHHSVISKIMDNSETSSYLSANLVSSVTTLSDVELPDYTVTINDSNVAEVINFVVNIYDKPLYIGRNQSIYLYFEVDGINGSHSELNYEIQALGVKEDDSTVIGTVSLQDGANQIFIDTSNAIVCSKILFKSTQASFGPNFSVIPIKISNIKVAYHDIDTKPTYTPPLTTLKDNELLDKIKWCNLKCLASSRNIQLVDASIE